MERKVRIRQVRSLSGRQEAQRATVRALGIVRLNQVVEHVDTPQIRGMIFKVRHLVEVEDVHQDR
ncbi:MAG: 50S ribosomal protein L30 [Candidatus Eisenbacteria bacterium]|uniref:50S ribosomal protein L30 n=1 Tax=Eiseniibacteriota bacterium TaxID=2212470 RepID=A0A538U0I6_UNCEI|nr:MAG: 50S ribosomal protein L30 [Candidatus Eisenbacteria bacterium]